MRWRELCSNALAVGTSSAKLSQMIASDKVENRNTDECIVEIQFCFLTAVLLLTFLFFACFSFFFYVSYFGWRSSSLCSNAWFFWLLRAVCDSGNSGVKLNWPTFFESFHFHTISSV